MKRLSSVVSRYIVIISTVISAVAFISILAVMYRNFTNEYAETIKTEAYELAEAVNSSLEAVPESAHRVTIISPQGQVVFDNRTKEALFDSHIDREEITEALTYGNGFATRYSDTFQKKTVNAAVRLDNGYVLRVSDIQGSVFSMLGGTFWLLLVLFAVEIILAFMLALKVSKTVVKPINNLNLEDPKSTVVYKELLPLVEKIEVQNRQIATQMNQLQEEHQKQDAMRSEFTANVSHELKTPLTSISGYAELIKTGIAKKEDIENFAGKIYDESQRLVTLVGDIIKLSQLDGNEVPVKSEKIDLLEVCNAVVSHFEMLAAEKSITIEVLGEHIYITSVEQIVQEIIFNLCDNAVKYNREGGKVLINIRQYVDGVELSVSDTGIGIPQEDIDRIFERFYRVDKSHSKQIGGTGLGLSIVKHGAKFLGATVSVESELEKGTTVRVVF